MTGRKQGLSQSRMLERGEKTGSHGQRGSYIGGNESGRKIPSSRANDPHRGWWEQVDRYSPTA